MKLSVMEASVMAGSLGDIFWDLAPWMTYAAGNDLGCNIYVANNTAAAKEYALMARLTRGTTVISDEAIPVYGFAWFSRDYAVREGMVVYFKDLVQAQTNPRVADKPLMVKAIKVAGDARVDVVITNADAAMLHSASENLSMLQKCRVIILVD